MKALIPYLIGLLAMIALSLGLKHPIVWMLVAGLIAAIASMVLGGSTARKIGFNVAFLFLCLVGLEGWFHKKAKPPSRIEGTTYKQYLQHDHEVLGYAPIPGVTAKRKKVLGEDVIYDVDYNFDEQSLRVSTSNTNGGQSVAFFGGSFTFGEGVADEDTFPSQVGAMAGNKAIYNFGLHGYGPHQMLAALEDGYAAERTRIKPYHVIYQTLMWHVLRSCGRAEWDPDGPAYVLNEDGSLTRLGGFRENRKLGARLFDRSFFYMKVRDIIAQKDGRDIDLYIAIIKESAKQAETIWPGSEFHVLLWDTTIYPHHERLVQGMKDAGLRLHMVSEILPVDGEESRAFQLHPTDNHPNPKAYEKLAEYLLHKVL